MDRGAAIAASTADAGDAWGKSKNRAKTGFLHHINAIGSAVRRGRPAGVKATDKRPAAEGTAPAGPANRLEAKVAAPGFNRMT
ncbi:MAG: hypothetical protein H6907_13610 [Hyphomicrobiales bacterium]|nr:hypothetical protein [Hyphomicrobiales bacterium]